MVRLGGSSDSSYKRPPQTYQESLSTEQIKEKLKDYVKVEDISKVPLHTHIRYFIYQEDPNTRKRSRLFRLGGRLVNKDHHDKYVVLSNGNQSWSVNTTSSVLFRQLKNEEIHDRYEKQVASLKHKVSSLERKLYQNTKRESGHN